ncbi:MAG: formimidoylglutamate deiminase [Solirubrobacteraceae bacterium]
MKLWCELAWLGGERPESGVVIEVDGGRIATINVGVAVPPAGSERLGGLVIPGLANAHSHAFQRALRGRAQRHVSQNAGSPTDAGRPGSFWTWREQMYALAESVTPDAMHALARATFAEMALAGITLVGEFHYLHHAPGGVRYDDPNAMGHAVVHAVHEAGLRLTLLDACYLHAGIGAAAEGPQLRFCDADADDWRQRANMLVDGLGSSGDSVRIGAAIHSVRAVDPASAEIVAAWAADLAAPLHAHVSEQPAENEACIEAYGASPTGLLERGGALSPRFTAVHATHVSANDIVLLGGARAWCCLCPTTERDLADGVGPARALFDAGARLALGTDSNAIIEPLADARAVELDERLVTGVRGNHQAQALLEAATGGGYESLGWPEGGSLREGGLADLVAIRLGGVRMAGTSPAHALETLVFAGAAADVNDVMVGGRFVVREGAHVALDVPRELQAAVAGLDW